MGKGFRRVLHWTPRVLGILFAAFISLFALDAFGQGYGFWGSLAAFLIHMVPTGLILAALVVAWRWEWLGAVLFVALGAAYLIEAWGKFDWLTYALVSGPAFLTGALFLAGWLLRPRAPDSSQG